MECSLADKKCTPCKGGVPPLHGVELGRLTAELGGGWKVVDEHHLEKTYPFKNFRDALAFTNRVGDIAEEQGHHPTITIIYNKVKITLTTHAAGGLTDNDFIMARIIDDIGGES